MLRDIKTYMEIFESEPSRKKVPLKELLEQVIRGLLSRGGYGKPTIEMDIPDEAAYILADPGDMRVLFEHLIENSLEALEEKDPFVRISSKIEDAASHSILVEIFNTGVPLREEDREKIFSPFYSTKPKGTGFGLSIARQAVRKNMGRIRIEPAGNAGTRVVLGLPLYREGGE